MPRVKRTHPFFQPKRWSFSRAARQAAALWEEDNPGAPLPTAWVHRIYALDRPTNRNLTVAMFTVRVAEELAILRQSPDKEALIEQWLSTKVKVVQPKEAWLEGVNWKPPKWGKE